MEPYESRQLPRLDLSVWLLREQPNQVLSGVSVVLASQLQVGSRLEIHSLDI